jgi:hypothetical protein
MKSQSTVVYKGDIIGAFVAQCAMTEFGVQTDWVVRLWFQSPTGDLSDVIVRDLPCLSREQAEQIAERYNQAVGLDNNR